MSRRNEGFVEDMAKLGWLPLSDVATTLKMGRSTLWRWVKNGEVVSEEKRGMIFVKRVSVIAKIGREEAVFYGLMPAAATAEDADGLPVA